MAKKKADATEKTTTTKESAVENKPEPTGYLVTVFVKREPVEKNQSVADIFYRKNSDSITLSCYAPNKTSEIEMIVGGDISVPSASGSIKMISKSESPETWMLNLHASNEFSGNPFIASQPEALYEA